MKTIIYITKLVIRTILVCVAAICFLSEVPEWDENPNQLAVLVQENIFSAFIIGMSCIGILYLMRPKKNNN